jgi:hypothetical protein
MGGQTSGEIEREIEGRSFGKACLVVAVIAVLAIAAVVTLFVRSGAMPGPKQVTQIPSSFPSQFTLFRPEKIFEMYEYPSSAKRGMASFVLAPIRAVMKVSGKGDLPKAFDGAVSSVTDRDTASFAWKDLDASSDDVLRFYAGSFKEVGLLNPYVRALEDRSAVEMVATSTVINASLVIIDQPGTPALDTVTLVVDYPSEGVGGR